MSAKILIFATLACILGQPVLTGTGLQSAATEGLGNTAQEQGVLQVMQVNWTEASKCSKWSNYSKQMFISNLLMNKWRNL